MNQYTLINNTAPEYDADGNMTTFGNGWVYTYNGENRITQATKGSTSVTMTYDYAGRRISKTVSVSGVVQNSYKYAYDGFKLIAVYNNNDLVMTFTWQPESLGMDVPISMTLNLCYGATAMTRSRISSNNALNISGLRRFIASESVDFATASMPR